MVTKEKITIILNVIILNMLVSFVVNKSIWQQKKRKTDADEDDGSVIYPRGVWKRAPHVIISKNH